MELGPSSGAGLISHHFEEWRHSICRFDLSESLGLQDWMPVLNQLNAHLVAKPSDSPIIPRSAMLPLAAMSPDRHIVLQIALADGVSVMHCQPMSSAAQASCPAPVAMESPLDGSFPAKHWFPKILSVADWADL